jgi:predicted HAD superfamily hydrolase
VAVSFYIWLRNRQKENEYKVAAEKKVKEVESKAETDANLDVKKILSISRSETEKQKRLSALSDMYYYQTLAKEALRSFQFALAAAYWAEYKKLYKQAFQ